MMTLNRRNFYKTIPLLGLALNQAGCMKKKSGDVELEAGDDRQYWLQLLTKISAPILDNISQGDLRKKFNVQYSPTWRSPAKDVAYMEAFGRLIAGLAPFLRLPIDESPEGLVRKQLLLKTQAGLDHATNPSSPDYLYWGNPKSRQPLVDASFIACALLAAPEVLWDSLEKRTQKNIIHEFVGLRKISPPKNNWVLFSAIIESFLLSIGESFDAARIDDGIDLINSYYIGDGWYKDGEIFHFDHYNGYVIHPMLNEVLRVNVMHGRRTKEIYEISYRRMQRYGHFLERLISPEGYYPIIGRSSIYRAAAFWPLAKLALDDRLPEGITPAQVRCALTAVFKNIFVPSTFTKSGGLSLGFVGNQQAGIADYYSNTGSLYITSLAFLPLGLPATHEFWCGPFSEWTQKKAWSGKPFDKDYGVSY